jgi:hypothetical protein
MKKVTKNVKRTKATPLQHLGLALHGAGLALAGQRFKEKYRPRMVPLWEVKALLEAAKHGSWPPGLSVRAVVLQNNLEAYVKGKEK